MVKAAIAVTITAKIALVLPVDVATVVAVA